MILENEIEKLKRTHRHGPLTVQERWQIVQAAAKNGMKGADLCDLDYSLMSADGQMRRVRRIGFGVRLNVRLRTFPKRHCWSLG
jgi:hypothetical protein